jgi:putative endonuclease
MTGDAVYFVYILTNRKRTLYVGVTNDLAIRVHQHREGLLPGFTRKYNLDRIVYFESSADVWSAIAREKQIKGWARANKNQQIESVNREWRDLSVELGLQ